MSDHPYAGSNTLVPGEAASDDPLSDEEYCHNCGDDVVPIPEVGECPTCGEDIN